VLGHPVAHSLSPVLHRAAYAELGLDWHFDAVDVAEDELAGFVARAESGRERGPAWRGLALTMPLKRRVLDLLHHADDGVRTVGAANTLLWEPDGSRRGANTDVPGVVAALRAAGPAGPTGEPAGGAAVVLGGGATAASAVAALAQLGHSDVGVRVRDPARAGHVAEVAGRVGIDLLVEPLDAGWDVPVGVLVSTVPAAAALAAVTAGGGWPGAVHTGGVVLDAVYDPWPSALLDEAARAGLRTVTGVDLLVHQAQVQVRLMCGRDVPVATLFAAAGAELRHRGEALPNYPQ